MQFLHKASNGKALQGEGCQLRLSWRARPTQNAPRKHYEVALHVGVVPIAGCPCLPERVEPNKRVCTCCFGIARGCSVHKVCVQQGLRPAGA